MSQNDTERAASAALSNSESIGLLLVRSYGIVAFWLAICVVFSVLTPAFLTSANLIGILEHTAIVAIFAAGETIVIMVAAIDISIAPVAAISGVISAKLLKGGAPATIALIAGLLVGVVCGWINGFITVRLRVSSLISTLGTFSAFSGLALIMTGGLPLFGLTGLKWLGVTEVLGVALPGWIMIGLFAAMTLIMGSTVWGVRLLAVGGSAEGARRAGVKVDRYVWGAFIACGTFAALAGVITFATLSTASPVSATSLIFDAITAVALGGVLLSGGRGSFPKVLIGALIITTISNGMILLDVPAYYELVTTGTLLVLAVAVDGILSRSIERRRSTSSATGSAELR